MALLDLPRVSSPARPLFDGLAALYNRYLTWNDSRLTRRALSALSDYELDDIGLTRGDINRF